jgi:hypothetical protein
MVANCRRTGRELLVVLVLSVIAALALAPTALAISSVPVGPNLCEDVPTVWECYEFLNKFTGSTLSVECYNRFASYAASKSACANYATQSKDTVTVACQDALRSLYTSCVPQLPTALTAGFDAASSPLCEKNKCYKKLNSCTGTNCIVADNDCCVNPSAEEGYCAVDHFGWLYNGCSKGQRRCCVRNKFRWGDDGETWTHCADGDVSKVCQCNTRVRYGDAASATWSLPRSSTSGTVSCSVSVFGDPKYGVKKTCQCSSPTPVTTSTTSSPTTWDQDASVSVKKPSSSTASSSSSSSSSRAELQAEQKAAAAADEAARITKILAGVLSPSLVILVMSIVCYCWKTSDSEDAELSEISPSVVATSEISGQIVMPAQGGPPPMAGPQDKGAPPADAMPASVADPLGCGVWEPQKDLQTGKIFWANHSLQKTTWDPPTGST